MKNTNKYIIDNNGRIKLPSNINSKEFIIDFNLFNSIVSLYFTNSCHYH
jgi:hypothetical protein